MIDDMLRTHGVGIRLLFYAFQSLRHLVESRFRDFSAAMIRLSICSRATATLTVISRQDIASVLRPSFSLSRGSQGLDFVLLLKYFQGFFRTRVDSAQPTLVTPDLPNLIDRITLYAISAVCPSGRPRTR